MTPAEVWAALAAVPDPGLPAISVVDLGVVRMVEVERGRCTIRFTPTHLGCPASRAMVPAIEAAVRALGLEVSVVQDLSPPWTSDALGDAGREKLHQIGVAVSPRSAPEVVTCPHCGSADTALDNPFGGAPCRTLRYCSGCRQPFQHVRPPMRP